jgi:hypothetical protein
MTRLLLLISLTLGACDGAPAPIADVLVDDSDGKADSTRTLRGDFRERTVLPYAGGWLDARTVLDGLGQIDHLRATTRDDVRCGAMVGMAASILGGADAFARLYAHVEKHRSWSSRDRRLLATVGDDLGAASLTTRDLHLFADALLRAYVPGSGGSSDGQIAEMLRASGLHETDAGSDDAATVIAGLAAGEMFPLTLDIDGDGTGWHVTLVWRDADGVWLYTSVTQSGDPHVAAQGSDYFTWHLAQPTASDPLKKKFHY